MVDDGSEGLDSVEEWLSKFGDLPGRGRIEWIERNDPGLAKESGLALTAWEAVVHSGGPCQPVHTEKVRNHILRSSCLIVVGVTYLWSKRHSLAYAISALGLLIGLCGTLHVIPMIVCDLVAALSGGYQRSELFLFPW